MSFHAYTINELYSNADGSVQFIEMAVGGEDGEGFWAGHSITVSHGGTTHSFTFPTDLPSEMTANTTVLIATQAFANLGIVSPDFIIPAGFLFTNGGTVNYAGVDTVIYAGLPTDGSTSLDRSGNTVTAVATNFAGVSSTLSAPNLLNDSITQLYVGYYNRAPDPGGETYWVGQLQGGMSLSAIAQSYSVQTESTALYPFLASPNTASTAAVKAFVDAIYANLFNRQPDSGGEAYWVNNLQTGASTVGGAIIDIISGAQGNDLLTVNNKVTVGNYFDTQIFNHNVLFSGTVALAALNAVTFSASSIATAEAIVDGYVLTAPHAAQAATASQTEVNLVGISPSHDLAIAA